MSGMVGIDGISVGKLGIEGKSEGKGGRLGTGGGSVGIVGRDIMGTVQPMTKPTMATSEPRAVQIFMSVRCISGS